MTANLVLCTKWVHGRCAKAKRITTTLVVRFVCSKCREIMEEMMDSINKLCGEVETVNGFYYLGEGLNARGGCEAAITARRTGGAKFRKCGKKLLLGHRFSLKTKGKVYVVVYLTPSEGWGHGRRP